MGASANEVDSSKNSVVHYAAAYGWFDCLKFLIEKAGADPTVSNSWNTTPISIAMMKGHLAIVDYLSNCPNVNVDARDDTGKTLISQSIVPDLTAANLSQVCTQTNQQTASACLPYCSCDNQHSLCWIAIANGFGQIKYLVVDKHADPTIADMLGNMPLHHLAATKPQDGQSDEQQSDDDDDDDDDDDNSDDSEDDDDDDDDDDDNSGNNHEADEGTMDQESTHQDDGDAMAVAEEHQAATTTTATDGDNNGSTSTSTVEATPPIIAVAIAKILVSAGADINARNQQNETAFRWAARAGNIALMQWLIKKGATLIDPPSVVDPDDDEEQQQQHHHQQRGRGSGGFGHYRQKKQPKGDGGKNILHFCAEKLLSIDFRPLLATISKFCPDQLRQLSHMPDDEGYLPIHRMIQTLNNHRPWASLSYWEQRQQAKDEQVVPMALEFLRNYLQVSGVSLALPIERRLNRRSAPLDEQRTKEQMQNKPDYMPHVGKYTALHFLYLSQCNLTLQVAGILQEYAQAQDFAAQAYDGRTPLHLAIATNNTTLVRSILSIVSSNTNQQLRLGDIQDLKGETPVFLAASHGFSTLLSTLLTQTGAQHSIANIAGEYPLHAAAASRHLSSVQVLINAQADVNLETVASKRTPLHYAVNQSTNSTDSSFELEEYLLSKGAKVNALDFRGRTPLHYAFVKIGAKKYRNTTQTDPIETVSSLCGVPGIELDVVDSFQKTPLHYAAQHGSTICSLYLLQREAALERPDGFGNTPLTIALASKHPDYAITLLQRGANVRVPVQLVTWNDRVDPVSKIETSTAVLTTQRTFYVAITSGWQGVAYMLLDNGYEYIDAMQDAISAGKFQLVLTLMGKTPDDATVQRLNAKGQNLFHLLSCYPHAIESWLTAIATRLSARGVSFSVRDTDGCLPLHYAAANAHHELLTRFLAAHRESVSAVDSNGDTALVHALRNTTGDKVQRNNIITALLHAKANPDVQFRLTSQSRYQITPLCYAVKTKQPGLLTHLINARAKVDYADSRGRTPIFYAIKANDKSLFQSVCC
jgi:ankyrin repeat protein